MRTFQFIGETKEKSALTVGCHFAFCVVLRGCDREWQAERWGMWRGWEIVGSFTLAGLSLHVFLMTNLR
jgi:hypothetical protein